MVFYNMLHFFLSFAFAHVIWYLCSGLITVINIGAQAYISNHKSANIQDLLLSIVT